MGGAGEDGPRAEDRPQQGAVHRLEREDKLHEDRGGRELLPIILLPLARYRGSETSGKIGTLL